MSSGHHDKNIDYGDHYNNQTKIVKIDLINFGYNLPVNARTLAGQTKQEDLYRCVI